MCLSKWLTGEATLVRLAGRDELNYAFCKLFIEGSVLIKGQQVADNESAVNASHVNFSVVVKMEGSASGYHSLAGWELCLYFCILLSSLHEK